MIACMMKVPCFLASCKRLEYKKIMLGRLYEGQECSAARALEEIGERWSILILRDGLFQGFTRFSEFQQSLGIASNILAKRLESFVASGIMQLMPLHGDQSEYRLTEKGKDLKPIVMACSAWGAKWVRPGRMIYGHGGCASCGQVELVICCPACGETRIAESAVEVRPRVRKS
jgi:DNA-binding HxlR family transcriptional regulator